MFSTIKIFLLIFAFFYKNAFCGELSFATEGLFCQVGVHIQLYIVGSNNFNSIIVFFLSPYRS